MSMDNSVLIVLGKYFCIGQVLVLSNIFPVCLHDGSMGRERFSLGTAMVRGVVEPLRPLLGLQFLALGVHRVWIIPQFVVRGILFGPTSFLQWMVGYFAVPSVIWFTLKRRYVFAYQVTVPK